MSKEQDFIKQITWRSKQPSILTWQIKTIGHQWQKLGYFMIFMLVVCFVIFVAILIHGYQFLMTPLMPVVAASIISLFLFGELRRKCWFVYRFTRRGAELCHWRAYPKGLFITIRWVFALLGVTVLIAGILIGNGILVALAPLGAILSIGSFAVTKGYQETMMAFTLGAFEWPYIVKATYDEKRNVIALDSQIGLTEQERQEMIQQGYNLNLLITKMTYYIFPIGRLTEEVLTLTKQSLPANVPLEYKPVELPEVV